MKKSLLALAVSLAAASGAHAAWDSGINSDLVTGNGEMLLAIWDPVTKNSYTQDLGIRYNDLKAGTAGGVYNLDTAALSVFAGSNLGNLQFSLMAASNSQYHLPDYNDGLTGAGVIYSTAPGQGPTSVADSNNYIFISGLWGTFSTYATVAQNGSQENPVKTVTAGGNGYAGGAQWDSLLSTVLGRDLSGGVGQTSNLWLQSFADDAGVAQLQKLLGTATFNFNGTTGSLTINQVPVPGAAWLLGSALLGLGSVARKRKQA